MSSQDLYQGTTFFKRKWHGRKLNNIDKHKTHEANSIINQNNIEYLNVTMKKFNLIDTHKIMQNLRTSEYICVSRAHITNRSQS